MIDAYFRSVFSALRAPLIVESHNITFDKRGPYAGYVRGEIFFVDGTQLHFREFVNTQAGVQRFTYVYHYSGTDDAMIFRYDDSPHFPGLPSFPHHKHLADGLSVVSSPAPTLMRVLAEIETLIAA